MRSELLQKLISSFRGPAEADVFFRYGIADPQLILDTAEDILSHVPNSFGACASLSAL
jgi:hypothetical protein